MIAYHCTRLGFYAGTISERASYVLLSSSRLVRWFKEKGIPCVVFSGLHGALFYAVSTFRLRMSIDLYIERFLPLLVEELRKECGDNHIQIEVIYDAIILPMFETLQPSASSLRGNILVDFTSVNRGFFSKHTNDKLGLK
ncbi:unnamed protein product [Echinostoma caproni]|uniref:Uroporphyrinogen_deCOase domain-containing protein n=1 Tax=Echinostoma caproni TaxID=27848 RepID=A0A183AKE8_9TREM|nr:unnamed protein product [Echinostoma caproni]